MEPRTPADRYHWLELTVEGLAHEARSLRAQVRALAAIPPELPEAERALVELLLAQLAVVDRQCAFLHAELARLEGTPAPTAGRPDRPAARGADEPPAEAATGDDDA